MLRDNLTKNKNDIPNIEITESSLWRKTIEISFSRFNSSNLFSISDLFLVIRSYSDNLTFKPTHMYVRSRDLTQKKKSIFTDAISMPSLMDMSLIDFSVWYENRWDSDWRYNDNNPFEHYIYLKHFSKIYCIRYPIYPWKEQVMNEVLSNSFTEKDKIIISLKERIKTLEIENEKILLLLKNKNKR